MCNRKLWIEISREMTSKLRTYSFTRNIRTSESVYKKKKNTGENLIMAGLDNSNLAGNIHGLVIRSQSNISFLLTIRPVLKKQYDEKSL